MGIDKHFPPLAHVRGSAQGLPNRDREGAATQSRFAREAPQ